MDPAWSPGPLGCSKLAARDAQGSTAERSGEAQTVQSGEREPFAPVHRTTLGEHLRPSSLGKANHLRAIQIRTPELAARSACWAKLSECDEVEIAQQPDLDQLAPRSEHRDTPTVRRTRASHTSK